MSAPFQIRGALALLAVLMALAGREAGPLRAQDAPQEGAQAQATSKRFMEDEHAYYTTEIVRLNPYQRRITYSVYFKGNADTALVPRPAENGGVEIVPVPVARLHLMPDATSKLSLRMCLDQVCRVLQPTEYRARYRLVLAELQLNDTLSGKEDVYLHLEPGVVGLETRPGAAPVASPELTTLLPRLGDRDNALLGGVPLFRMDVSPLTQSTGTEQNALSLDFEGGIRRYGQAYRYGLAYSGQVATEEEASASSLRADLEYERNLQPSSYFPIRLTAGAESDQGFEVVNAVMSLQALRLLPFNLNYSPRDEGYIPNTGPLLTVTLEGGWNVRDEQENVSGTLGSAADTEESALSRFTRPGYTFRWKVPVGRDLVARLDHDGRWQYTDFFDGRPEYHPMWDAGLEYRYGGATYFIGYRRGEAPPLFRTVKAFAAGLVIGIK